jgi:hypothetical protein
VARRLVEVGHPAGRDKALPMVRGIQTARQVEGRAGPVPAHLLGHRLQGLEALGQPPPSCGMDRSHGAGRAHVALVGEARDAGGTLRGFIPRAPTASPPFGAPVLGPAPGSPRRARCCSAARGRTRAPTACPSAPASAHVAKTLSPVGSGMTGCPWAAGGMGKPCPGLPVSRPHQRQGKPRYEPTVPCGARWGIDRCGKIHAGTSLAERWTGRGGVAGMGAVVLMMPSPYERHGDGAWRSE